ncbi:MAG: hypothetical protein H6621_00865 [Halobacteriovoraceae bacterium]|nr:hypothetical protein [Halobacteriovoraceae bacterium]MCB9093592.1 hypothetical protein [Halobacteriovoraceae bacterium]
MKFFKRPIISSFLALKTQDSIAIRATMSMSQKVYAQIGSDLLNEKATSPWDNLEFFQRSDFRLKIVGLSPKSKILLVREINTDEYAMVQLKIPSQVKDQEITSIQIYEIKYKKGFELLMGSFIPLKLNTPKKVLITDFDKTLVDTKYSTMREVYDSLSKPINYFPTVQGSVDLVKRFLKEGYGPFVLSASPHFYEKSLRDWLYQNEIFTSNIFLKDYRKIFTLSLSELTTKDLKAQGFYKLNELVQILIMTGIPDNLVLIGDGFESDPMIYLIIRSIIIEQHDPWVVWKKVRALHSFKLTRRQQSKFLTNLHNLASLKRPPQISLQIYIRCRETDLDSIRNRPLHIDFLDNQRKFIDYYKA